MKKAKELEGVNILDVISKHVHLRREGKEYRGICPFHPDKDPSLYVNPSKNVFMCAPCGAKGDAIDFLMAYGLTFQDAVKEIKTSTGTFEGNNRESSKTERESPFHFFIPEKRQPPPDDSHPRLGIASKIWAYKSAAGIPYAYIFRFNLEGGGKDTRPISYGTYNGRTGWHWFMPTPVRYLFNLDLITANPDARILIVEGEKCAEYLSQYFAPEKLVVTCWMGGARAVSKTDWTPLDGRTVFLWPDNDNPGRQAMRDIAELVHGDIYHIHNPAGMPKAWDAADRNWTRDEIVAYIRDNSHRTSEPLDGEPDPEPNPEPEPELPPPPPALPPPRQASSENTYFAIIGQEKTDSDKPGGVFYSFASSQIIRYSASSLSQNNLLTLAPINFWEEMFPGSRGKLDLTAAINWVVQKIMRAPLFDADRMRGRGAWMDGKNVVIHAGDHLVINGERREFHEFKSRFFYEQRLPLEFDLEDPATSDEASTLITLFELYKWEREVSATLLAGWCVIAPICGALSWRPHIWLTGGAGTGKSWIMQNIILRMMGNVCLHAEGDTTSPGIRQALESDALPVIFDEAEGEDQRAAMRIQDILNLMRSASTKDGGKVIKGTAGGRSQKFTIRSCFAFASIGIRVSQQSDRSRVTILGIRKEDDPVKRAEAWQEIQRRALPFINTDLPQRIRARTIKLLPAIIQNAGTFAAAAAAELGNQRSGDQLGALLAGAYSLTCDDLINFDDARLIIRQYGWEEERGNEDTRDELQLLNHLIGQIVQVETAANTRKEITIAELITIAAQRSESGVINGPAADEKLRRYGFRVDQNSIFISNNAEPIKSFLRNTPWDKNHWKTLVRIDGAETGGVIYFVPGIQSRTVKIPLRYVVQGVTEPMPF